MAMTFKGADNKTCMAKTAFMYSLGICLIKILISGVAIGDMTFEQADYTGMAAFLAPVAAIYYGRAKTKAEHQTYV